MDVRHPIRVLGPTLEGPILEVLARTTGSLTGREVHQRAQVGSAAGVRLALLRLAEQGLVHVDRRSTAVYYTANRDHLAWPAVSLLVSLREQLLIRIRGAIESWSVRPVHASMFGSAARGDGDSESDIDVLLVRPDEMGPDESPWAEDVDELRHKVLRWTGNRCQTFEIDRTRLAEHIAARDRLADEWLRDSVTLCGPDLRTVIVRLPRGDASGSEPERSNEDPAL